MIWILLFCLTAERLPQQVTAQEKRVYVIARHTAGNLDLGAEKKVKDELAKRKNLKLVTGIADADIVLLVLTEYATAGTTVGTADRNNGSLIGVTETYLKTAFGIAVPVESWDQHKENLEKLREQAVWQDDVAATMLTRASLPKLIKKYIESLKN